jgi:hypothetical protein
MVESSLKAVRPYKTVQTPHSSSLLHNNLSTVDGKNFITVKNTEKGGMISLYSDDLLSATTESTIPQKVITPTTNDCMSAKFIKIQKQLLAVVCSMQSLFIYDETLNKQLFKFDLATPTLLEWFTCSSISYIID